MPQCRAVIATNGRAHFAEKRSAFRHTLAGMQDLTPFVDHLCGPFVDRDPICGPAIGWEFAERSESQPTLATRAGVQALTPFASK